jgi:NTP pyrophosphatase (non-canonical NTP hydrolase)
MELKDLQSRIEELAKAKDWGTKPDDIIFAEKLALLHSEVSETLEAYRQNKITGPHSVTEELGDVIMRTIHLANIYNIDLEKQILNKIETNKTRDWSKDQLYIDRDKRNK